MDTNAPEEKTEKKMYGWYSQNMCNNMNSIVVYKHVDGKEVNCTVISRSPTKHNTLWTDIVCLGEITNYLRTTDGNGNPRCPEYNSNSSVSSFHLQKSWKQDSNQKSALSSGERSATRCALPTEQ